MAKPANKAYIQAIFDARDILLPTGHGKGGQRRRSDLRNIVLTLATQGDPRDDSRNGLWWDLDRISTITGIGKNQLLKHLRWLESVGLMKKRHRMNTSTVRWIDRDRLRGITQRQEDDRQGYLKLQEAALTDEHQRIQPFDPPDLEDVYFTTETSKECTSEALPEAPKEAQSEQHSEEQPEARTE